MNWGKLAVEVKTFNMHETVNFLRLFCIDLRQVVLLF